MKMKLTHDWRGNPPGTIIDATPGQQVMIATLGYGAPWTEPAKDTAPPEDATTELENALAPVPMPAKKRSEK